MSSLLLALDAHTKTVQERARQVRNEISRIAGVMTSVGR